MDSSESKTNHTLQMHIKTNKQTKNSATTKPPLSQKHNISIAKFKELSYLNHLFQQRHCSQNLLTFPYMKRIATVLWWNIKMLWKSQKSWNIKKNLEFHILNFSSVATNKSRWIYNPRYWHTSLWFGHDEMRKCDILYFLSLANMKQKAASLLNPASVHC